MTEGAPEPDDCTTLAEVAAGIEAIDLAIIAQLARRFAYMWAAAALKDSAAAVTDEAPHRARLMHARRAAFEQGVPVGLVGDFWDRLVDASIAYERQAWERLHRDEGS